MKYLILIALALVSACTTLKEVDMSGSTADTVAQLDIGEIITVQTVNNEKFEMKVVEITTEEIVGKYRTVPIAEVSHISKRELQVGRTVGAAAGGAVLTYLALVLLIIVSL